MEAARPAGPGDLPALAALARQAIDELALLRGGAVWRQQDGRREPVDEGLAAQLADGPEAGLVVAGTVDGTVVAYGVSRLEPLADGTTLSVVTDLYVEPAARGIGIGEAMMGLLVGHAEDAGAVGIDSLALPGDRATKNFFETFGLKARAIVVHRALGPAGVPVEPEAAAEVVGP